MKIFLFILHLFLLHSMAYGVLVGGRPNAFSGGQNAFAGIINPANAVWVADRFDFGTFWVNQKSTLNNRDNNPLFLPGKADLTYKARNILTVDGAIHKHIELKIGKKHFDSSCTLATYTMPSVVKLRTKNPIPISGTTPIRRMSQTNVISLVFSLRLNASHSIGCSLDYLHFSYLRNGNQNSDTFLRSVSPGHVTNNGCDYSNGIGLTIGWRWKITKKLDFGTAWSKKSYGGQFRKYRGFEPHHARNYTPQLLGAGFSYHFSPKLAGRLEVLWSNLSNLPNANNNVLANGKPNLHKRGSKKSPGSGLNDATFLNMGLGYQVNSMLSIGIGFSHRLRFPRKTSNIISHSYMLQTIYNVLSIGANFNYQKHELFLTASYGFKNSVSGWMPKEAGGGRFTGEKQTTSISVSWGYKY